jgi:hypothetical protein
MSAPWRDSKYATEQKRNYHMAISMAILTGGVSSDRGDISYSYGSFYGYILLWAYVVFRGAWGRLCNMIVQRRGV